VTIGAAVKTASSEQRDKSSFGHRKPARSDNPEGRWFKSASRNHKGIRERMPFFFGVFRRGDKPPVLLGEDKKALAKEKPS